MNHMDDFVRNTKVSRTDLLHVCLFKNCLCDAVMAIRGLVALTALGMDWTEELKTTQ